MAQISFQILNQSGAFSDDQFFLLAKGKQPSGNTDPNKLPEAFLEFDENGAAVFVAATLQSKSSNFVRKLSEIRPDANGRRLLTVPNVFSGRLYLSIGQPVSLAPKIGGGLMTLQDPDPFLRRDPSYAVIYDKVEFSLDSNNIFFLNTTAVDFFAIPISLFGAGDGTPKNPDRRVGLTNSRQQILDTLKETLTKDWAALLLSFGGQVLRVSAPNKQPDFNRQYLDPHRPDLGPLRERPDHRGLF